MTKLFGDYSENIIDGFIDENKKNKIWESFLWLLKYTYPIIELKQNIFAETYEKVEA